MMRQCQRTPTDAELEILTVLWDRGPSTVREVSDVLGRTDAYTTILKLLQIMTEKRLVTRHEIKDGSMLQRRVVAGSDTTASRARFAASGLRRVCRSTRAAGSQRG